MSLKRRVPDHELWSVYVNDPDGFVRNVIGARPQEWQTNAMNMIATGGNIRNAVKSCHGPGKTTLLAWLILWWICTRPFPRIACTAPTEHQLNDKLWPELHKWHRTSKAELWRWFEWEGQRYFLREEKKEWFAVARVARVQKTENTAGEAFGMQGFHSEHMLFLVDESSGVDDAVWGAIEGALSTSTDVKVVACGNPNSPKGWFYNAFNKHKSLWNRMTVSYRDSPNVSNKWAEDMILMYGIDHPWVRVKVLGEFPNTLEHGLFNYQMLEAAQVNKIVTTVDDAIVLGIDVARYGDNRSVFSVAVGGDVQSMKSYEGLDTVEVGLEAEYVAKTIGVDYIVVDSDGVGAGTTDTLRKLLKGQKKIKLIEWHGGVNAVNNARFSNSRTELAWKMRDAVAEKKVSLPENEALLRQGSAVRYDFDSVGRIRLERKEKLKKLIGESPDELDSTMYSLVPFLYGESLSQIASTALTAEDIIL